MSSIFLRFRVQSTHLHQTRNRIGQNLFRVTNMGWSHPDISLEDLLKLIKGFVDILILASGYQSSGHLAHWDALNIKKALEWGLFFENVFKRLGCSGDYQDSIEEVDAALCKMTSNPYFPQGLAHLSSATLGRARNFISEHLICTLPLRETHLRAFLKSTIELDLDQLSRTESDCLHVYLQKMKQNTLLNPSLAWRCYMEDTTTSSSDISNRRKAENCIDGDCTVFTIQELMRRQVAVSCITSAETCLDTLSKIIIQSNWTEPCDSLFREHLKHATAPMTEEQLFESVMWNHWRTKNLSYLLDKRTIRLVSGARMIFSAPKIQWVQVFERLDVSAGASDDNLSETMELLLLGCAASKWSSLIEHFMLVSFNSLTISTQYHDVRNVLQGRFQDLHSTEEILNSKYRREKKRKDFEESRKKGENMVIIPPAVWEFFETNDGIVHPCYRQTGRKKEKEWKEVRTYKSRWLWEEKDILECLEGLLGSQIHQLWNLPSALAAIAIPSWYTIHFMVTLFLRYPGDHGDVSVWHNMLLHFPLVLNKFNLKSKLFRLYLSEIESKFRGDSSTVRSKLFRLYLSEIESKFRGDSSTVRCCSCIEDGKEHRDCEVAERIWCLHIFHGCGSQISCGAKCA
ncbi:unnamed protein product [Ilex paraguariensis]|uniref:Uncharacterized protein n=1 Tax=Ilex paraguariensis TaxID=185542 RepID=A0ABC8T533_9AQUA